MVVTRQCIVWVTLLEILKGFVCESKAFGLDFIIIKEPAQKSKFLELQKGIKRVNLC